VKKIRQIFHNFVYYYISELSIAYFVKRHFVKNQGIFGTILEHFTPFKLTVTLYVGHVFQDNKIIQKPVIPELINDLKMRKIPVFAGMTRKKYRI
jgi:hypothetical protein